VFSATPSYCIHLLSVAERMGVDLRRSTIRHMLVGGEPGGSLPGTRKIIEEGWGATAVDAGSTSEMYPFQTSVGCTAGTGTHLYTDEVFTEVVDAADLNAPVPVGDRGAVVYTHLWRDSQPMIRFAPGDETYLATDPCPCGRTYPRMPEGILGRLDDMLVIRGANVFPSAVETGLRTVPELGPEFRMVVRKVGALDELTVQAELGHGAAGERGPSCRARTPHRGSTQADRFDPRSGGVAQTGHVARDDLQGPPRRGRAAARLTTGPTGPEQEQAQSEGRFRRDTAPGSSRRVTSCGPPTRSWRRTFGACAKRET
jgi:phenylacetate-coenzyme A ligase PaaK-like adenylate-forming protein